LDFGLGGHPRFQILLKTFLRLEVFRDDHNRTAREKLLEQRDKKRLRCRRHAGATTMDFPTRAAGRGIARREFSRCQPTNCRSLTLLRFAPSVGKFAGRRAKVK